MRDPKRRRPPRKKVTTYAAAPLRGGHAHTRDGTNPAGTFGGFAVDVCFRVVFACFGRAVRGRAVRARAVAVGGFGVGSASPFVGDGARGAGAVVLWWWPRVAAK